MKKLTIVLLFVALAAAGTFAVTPEYFTFEIGAMGTYTVSDGSVDSINPFGIQFTFDDTFSAGFSFAGGIMSLMNITATPMENVNFSMFTGDVNGELGFGAGIGYDFLTKKSALFTKMGLYLNWLVNGNTVADAYDIDNGGVLALGLKAGFGL